MAVLVFILFLFEFSDYYLFKLVVIGRSFQEEVVRHGNYYVRSTFIMILLASSLIFDRRYSSRADSR